MGKINTNKVKDFLAEKGLIFVKFPCASDEENEAGLVDLNDGKIRIIEVEIRTRTIYKYLLVTDKLFIIMDENRSRVDDDFSADWQKYLATIAQQKDKKQLEEKFNSFKNDLEADNFDDITLKQEIREYLADKQNDVYNHNSFDDILE